MSIIDEESTLSISGETAKDLVEQSPNKVLLLDTTMLYGVPGSIPKFPGLDLLN